MRNKLVLTIILLTACFCLATPVQAKAKREKVTFHVHLHCDACIQKIMKTIAFEKGVKDIVCSQENQTVEVTYNAAQTDVPTLQKAFAKIGKPATLLSEADKEEHHHHDEEACKEEKKQ